MLLPIAENDNQNSEIILISGSIFSVPITSPKRLICSDGLSIKMPSTKRVRVPIKNSGKYELQLHFQDRALSECEQASKHHLSIKMYMILRKQFSKHSIILVFNKI